MEKLQYKKPSSVLALFSLLLYFASVIFYIYQFNLSVILYIYSYKTANSESISCSSQLSQDFSKEYFGYGQTIRNIHTEVQTQMGTYMPKYLPTWEQMSM